MAAAAPLPRLIHANTAAAAAAAAASPVSSTWHMHCCRLVPPPTAMQIVFVDNEDFLKVGVRLRGGRVVHGQQQRRRRRQQSPFCQTALGGWKALGLTDRQRESRSMRAASCCFPSLCRSWSRSECCGGCPFAAPGQCNTKPSTAYSK